MLGIAVNEMQRSLNGPHYNSRDALFHYQMTHPEPRGPRMRIADPTSGWWSTRRVAPLAFQGREWEHLPTQPLPIAAQVPWDSRDALFHYQMMHREPYGPQMHVADPETGWWSTRRVIPYSIRGRRVDVVSRHRGLGDVPNDAEAAIDLQYTPVREGWFYGVPVQGFPNSQRDSDPTVLVGNAALAALGDPTAALVAQSNGDALSMRRLVRAQRAQTALQVVSTLSIATLAGLAIAKAVFVSREKKAMSGWRRRSRAR
jgi:hypothetical protein